MKNMVFNGFILNYHESMNVYVNDETKSVFSLFLKIMMKYMAF